MEEHDLNFRVEWCYVVNEIFPWRVRNWKKYSSQSYPSSLYIYIYKQMQLEIWLLGPKSSHALLIVLSRPFTICPTLCSHGRYFFVFVAKFSWTVHRQNLEVALNKLRFSKAVVSNTTTTITTISLFPSFLIGALMNHIYTGK